MSQTFQEEVEEQIVRYLVENDGYHYGIYEHRAGKAFAKKHMNRIESAMWEAMDEEVAEILKAEKENK